MAAKFMYDMVGWLARLAFFQLLQKKLYFVLKACKSSIPCL